MTRFLDSAEELWDEFDKIFPGGAGDIESAYERVGVEEFFEFFIDAFSKSVKESLSSLLLLFGLCITVSVMARISFTQKWGRLTEIAGLTVSSFLIFETVKPLLFSVKDALITLSDFISSLLPVFTGVLFAVGNVSTAETQALNMTLISAIISFLAKNLLLPIVFFIFAFAMASPISSKEGEKSAKWLKTVFFVIFGLASTLLFGSLSLQSVIASSSDTIYLKTAKQMLSSVVPVVGSTISTSLSSLMGAFGMIKSSAGALSIVFILTLFLPSFLSLLFARATLSLCSSFMDFCSMEGGVRLFNSFLAGIDTLLCVYVISFLGATFSVTTFMKSGVEIFG